MATDYASMIPKEDLASFQKANPGLTFDAQEYAHYNNSTINSQNLAQGASVKIPTYQPTPVDPSIATSAIASVAGQYEALNKQQEQAQAEQKAQAESQLSLQSALIGKTADTQAFQETAGVNAANDTVRQYATQLADLNAQASTLNREAQAIPIQVQNESVGRGRTGAGIAPIESARLRDNALKALSIAQQADIASAALTGSQLKLQAAKDKAQQMVDLKYKPIEDQLAIKKNQYELNKDILSQIDKKRTEALNAAIKKEEQQLADQKANEKGISDLVTNAAGQGAPADLRARAAKAKTPMEAANILGVYAGDYLKNELLKEQLKTEKAQQDKFSADAQKTRSEIGTSGVSLKPLTEVQAKDLTYAQRTSQATPTIANLESKITAMNPAEFWTQWKLVQSPLTSGQVSPEMRQYYQAAKNFTSATLRRESGASIASGEYNDAFSTYLPFPGDDSKTLSQKKQARDTTVLSFKQNVPGYDQRVATVEDTYLDKQVIPSVIKTEQQTSNPISNYRMKLQGLPGVKQ